MKSSKQLASKKLSQGKMKPGASATASGYMILALCVLLLLTSTPTVTSQFLQAPPQQAIQNPQDLPFNYQNLAQDWVDRPNSYCGSMEQSPINLRLHNDPANQQQQDSYHQHILPANFMPKLYLPSITNVTIVNTGENINLDFDVVMPTSRRDDQNMIVYSPKNASFPSLYGDYQGTGKLEPPTDRHPPFEGMINEVDIASMKTGAATAATANKNNKAEVSEPNPTNLVDIHWHVPAEHTINGRLAAAEMHLVHHVVRPDDDPSCQFDYQGQKSCIVVLSILFDMYSNEQAEGGFDLLDSLGKLPIYKQNRGGTITDVDGTFDLQSMLSSNNKNNDTDLWTYRGSLTTPGCNENVTWYVLQEPRPLSWSTWIGLRNALVHPQLGDLNARPPQPLHNRIVYRSAAAAASTTSMSKNNIGKDDEGADGGTTIDGSAGTSRMGDPTKTVVDEGIVNEISSAASIRSRGNFVVAVVVVAAAMTFLAA